jgi:hypothetical protein
LRFAVLRGAALRFAVARAGARFAAPFRAGALRGAEDFFPGRARFAAGFVPPARCFAAALLRDDFVAGLGLCVGLVRDGADVAGDGDHSSPCTNDVVEGWVAVGGGGIGASESSP